MNRTDLSWLALFGAVAASPAVGQEAAGEAGIGGSRPLEEVVITAQRREQRLLDVPISVSALDQAALEVRNMGGISRLDSYVPNLRVYKGTYAASSTLAIRGSAEINPTPYFDPTVGTYIDGVYLGKALGNLFNVADLERVEVLRGPQGTLYGRNTFAGAINLISAKPTGEFGGKVRLGAGDYGAVRGSVDLNLPALGDFAFKLSGLIDQRDGTVDVHDNPYPNVVNAKPRNIERLEDVDNTAFRGAIRYAPEGAFLADYAFDYSSNDATPAGTRLRDVAMEPLVGAIFDPSSPSYVGGLVGGTYFGFPADLYLQPGYSDHTYANGGVNNAPPREELRTTGHALTLSYDVGSATLKSISSARNMRFTNAFDLDGTPLPLAGTYLDNDFEQYSQELQVTGSAGRVSYTGGLYYYNEHGSVVNQQQFFGNATTTDLHYRFGTDAYAAYAQADFEVSDRWTVTGGLRYSSEEKRMNASLQLVTEATGVETPVYAPTTDEQSTDAWTPTAIVKYDFSDDANVYVKFARGFKSGGYNLGTNPAFAVTHYDPEFVNSYELGTKLRLASGALQINAAAFFNDIEDLQVSVFRNNGIFTASVVDNAASAEVRGVELEVQATPFDWLRLTGGLGYTDSEYQDYVDAGVDVSKTRAIPIAPELTSMLSADTRLFDNDFGALHLILDYSHSDSFFVQAFDVRPRSATIRQSAQTTRTEATDLLDVTLRLTNIESALGDLELSLWSKNVLNTHRRAGGVDFGPAFGNLTSAFYSQPRTWGADFTLRF